MGNSRSFLAALCLPLISCTFLFTPDESGGGGNDDAGVDDDAGLVECEGLLRTYDRGQPVDGDANRFEYLDYAQGTITLWAKALDAVNAEVELVNLGGIRIVVNENGSVTATVPAVNNTAGESYTSEDGLVDWAEGEDNFVALRWDSKREVSGNQGGGSHLMLRVNQTRGGAVMGPFDAAPRNITAMTVGDPSGLIHVDQVVVYGRPLYVEDGVNEYDEVGAMSNDKSSSAELTRGGVDVSFATSSPIYSGCSNYESLAWSMPTMSEVGGEVRSGGTGITWDVPPGPVPQEELIFSSGVAVSRPSSGLTSSFDLELDADTSYSVYALAHGIGSAVPRINVRVLDSGTPGEFLLDDYAYTGTVEEPESMLSSFQTPAGRRFVRVELSNGNGVVSSLAIFHTLVIRENFFRNASFEIAGEGGEILDGWELRVNDDDGGSAFQGYEASDPVNSGTYCACFSGQGRRSDATQLVDQTKYPLEQEDFYASGAMFFRGAVTDAIAPGITTGNSSFFGTGAPHEVGGQTSAESPSREDWRAAGVVAFRLHQTEFSANNEHIYFGGLSGQPSDVLDHCMDDAYFYPVTKIEGVFDP